MMRKARSLFFLFTFLPMAILMAGNNNKPKSDYPFYKDLSSSEAFITTQEARLAKAQQTLEKLLRPQSHRNIANTLRLYDEILRDAELVSQQASLIQNVHPDSSYRTAAETMDQKASSFFADLSLNRGVYDALKAMDLSGADEKTKFYVARTLRDYRLSGVDKDETTRKKIKSLIDELTLIGQEFARNIRNDVRTVTVSAASELDGLPQDYIDRHKPAEDGKITLTINYPDAVPVFSYAKNDELRRRMFMEYNNRAYPTNLATLDKLLAQRYELAKLLGFETWADCVTADKMVENKTNARNFIDRIATAAREKAKKEYDMLLARKRQDIPDASELHAWEGSYWSELVRKSQYAFDAQSVRPYFPYENVKQGVLDVTAKLFGVSFKRVADAPIWHPSVECWEVFENGNILGRFYFDMHPRENKYSHAAQFGIRTGVKDEQIPEAVLVCNFPGGEEGDPGLMEHDDVQTFFHEFGHLLHNIFAGRQQWVGIGGIKPEWDFVEAPSQLLEEWVWDYATLASFAKHYQTGETIPKELVQQMKRADDFGKGMQVSTQMYYADLSLSCYNRKPENVQTTSLVKDLYAKYRPYKFVEGTNMQCSFGHLDGYSAIYYTYMWSLVIAKDLFSQFDRGNLLAPGAAKKYREQVLAQGGSIPAAKMVENFLGRQFDFKAWQNWLNEGE